jgi:tryptophanyl-tRNA synthetase
MYAERVLSGMRPTGSLHLGHYHGVLKNWVRLQDEYPCLFFVADWHALTTQYDDPQGIVNSSWEMVIDWLAAGVDPARAILFIQSQVPEHAELHLLLSMMTRWAGWSASRPTRTSRKSWRTRICRPTAFSAIRCCNRPTS